MRQRRQRRQRRQWADARLERAWQTAGGVVVKHVALELLSMRGEVSQAAIHRAHDRPASLARPWRLQHAARRDGDGYY